MYSPTKVKASVDWNSLSSGKVRKAQTCDNSVLLCLGSNPAKVSFYLCRGAVAQSVERPSKGLCNSIY